MNIETKTLKTIGIVVAVLFFITFVVGFLLTGDDETVNLENNVAVMEEVPSGFILNDAVILLNRAQEFFFSYDLALRNGDFTEVERFLAPSSEAVNRLNLRIRMLENDVSELWLVNVVIGNIDTLTNEVSLTLVLEDANDMVSEFPVVVAFDNMLNIVQVSDLY